jgi:predicted phosphodiesterase
VAGFTFLHAADLHIDSPLVGLNRYEGAPARELRLASRRAFENLVHVAIEEEVAFVVLAGDIFDGDWKDFNTGVFLNRELARLERAGARVYLVHGNHDAEGQVTRRLRLPESSHVFAADAPETVRFAEHRVALHGQSFKEQRVLQNLAVGYPSREPGWFNIGVLHTALEGRDGHLPYAPCKLEDLAAKGYDYWALGHVHKREEVSRSPWVVFPGNIQGRHARETGEKGCTLVRVEDGVVASVRHRPLDVVRWISVVEDVSSAGSAEEVVEQLAEAVREEAMAAGPRLVAARVRAYGRAPGSSSLSAEPERWRAELVSRVAARAGSEVWLEKVFFDVRSPDEGRAHPARELAVLDRLLEELASASDAPLPELVRQLQAKVGNDLPSGDDSPFSGEAIARARVQALELLRHRLRRPRGADA